MHKIRVFDTFSGLGLFSYAIRNVIGKRFESNGFVEINKYCQSQIRELFPDAKIYGDIRKTFPKKRAHIIAGSSPCTKISVASRSKFAEKIDRIDTDKSALWREQLRIVRRLRPPYVFMENSPNIISGGLRTLLGEYAQSRYAIWWQIISAQEIGFPHLRKRWYAVLADTDVVRFDTLSIFNREFNKILRETQKKAKQRMERQFGGLDSSHFFTKDYAKFLQMDNEYTHEENTDDIRAVGNAIIPDIPEMIMKALLKADDFTGYGF